MREGGTGNIIKCFYVYHLSLYTHTRPLIKKSARWWLCCCRHLRTLARVKRKKLGKPLIEPQLGNDPDDVEVLDDLDRVFGGDGGDGGGCMAV